MKKIFTLLAALMLTVSAGFAQQYYCFWKEGKVTRFSASEVDSLSFKAGSWLFQISKPGNLQTAPNSIEGSVNVSLSEKVKSLNKGYFDLEVGICYSDLNRVPTYNDNKKELGNDMGDYSFTISDLAAATPFYIRTYVKFLDEVYYSEVSSATTWGGTVNRDITINGHKFIDLGLPSGLLWAETNVGATSATEDGDYFAWGETEPKDSYTEGNYKWGSTPSKYNSTDKRITLDSEDDVATVKWGSPCRMPSYSEIKELRECEWSWKDDYNGASGYLITGPNGNTIFFPASGCRLEDSFHWSPTLFGFYWSSSLYESYYVTSARCISFYSGEVRLWSSEGRYFGLSVRPVAKK